MCCDILIEKKIIVYFLGLLKKLLYNCELFNILTPHQIFHVPLKLNYGS